MGKLDGKVAIITGSTSGMGRDTAYLFAKEGAKVVVTGRNEARAKAVVDKIAAEGGEAIYVLADTTDLSSNQKIFDETMKAYGTVDILMNNAGMLSLTPFEQLTMEEWNKVMNVNVTSPVVLTQLCAKVMKEKGKGTVINVSSVAGCHAHHGPAAYVTSKHAMSGLTKSMAWELGPTIRVNGICPGAIETAMLDAAGGTAALAAMAQNAPLKRFGQGNDIATVALFLACDDSSFMTGQLLRVDGGIDI